MEKNKKIQHDKKIAYDMKVAEARRSMMLDGRQAKD